MCRQDAKGGYGRIDLHMHTVYSDGADDVGTLMEHVRELGLTVISVTDHNSVGAYRDPAIRACSAILILGVEITCMYEGEVVEVLGYGFELSAMEQELRQHVLTFEEKQKREFALLCEAFTLAGVRYDASRVHFDPKKESCRKAFLAHLREYPQNQTFFSSQESWKSSRAFTRQEIYNPQSRLYVNEAPLYPDVKTAVEMIHRSGGIAFLAHLYIYAHAEQFRSRLREIVRENGLDGIECAHSAFTEEQIADLNQFCRDHDLLRSGGSDYHGSRKPDVKLGVGCGQLHITEEYLANWPENAVDFDKKK
ncbi:MAG: PHP domain-containing protein [bacterium]|nr:PHP domain-containing protein [bacterium]